MFFPPKKMEAGLKIKENEHSLDRSFPPKKMEAGLKIKENEHSVVLLNFTPSIKTHLVIPHSIHCDAT
jgi:hypothetical protein